MMSTWEHLGPVLMSTQPDCRSSHAQHGDQSDVEAHSDLVGTFMIMTDKCVHGPSETAPGMGTRATGSPKDTVGWPERAEMAVQEAVLPSRASTLGGTTAGGIKLSAGETGSTTPDSSIMLAIGSTYCSQLATQVRDVAGREEWEQGHVGCRCPSHAVCRCPLQRASSAQWDRRMPGVLKKDSLRQNEDYNARTENGVLRCGHRTAPLLEGTMAQCCAVRSFIRSTPDHMQWLRWLLSCNLDRSR